MTAAPAAPAVLRALHERVDVRRRQLGLAWWQIAVACHTDTWTLRRVRHGVASLRILRALDEWLRRHPAPTASAPSSDQ